MNNSTAVNDCEDIISGVDRNTTEVIRYFIGIVATLIVCLFGCVGNLLSIIVLHHEHLKSTTNRYLIALAIVDTCVLIATILLLAPLLEITPGSGKWWFTETYVALFPIVHPLALGFQVLSVWITVALTFDRYMRTSHPLSIGVGSSGALRFKLVLLGLILMSGLYALPRFFEYTSASWGGRQWITFTRIAKNQTYKILVHIVAYFIFQSGVPLVFLTAINIALMYIVKKAKDAIGQLSAHEIRRLDKTNILIWLVLVFLVCQIPALVSHILIPVDLCFHHTFAGQVLNEVSNFLITLNSAINVVVYFIVGNRFQRAFRSLFCKRYHRSSVPRKRNYKSSSERRQRDAVEMAPLGRGNGLDFLADPPPRRSYLTKSTPLSSSLRHKQSTKNENLSPPLVLGPPTPIVEQTEPITNSKSGGSGQSANAAVLAKLYQMDSYRKV